MRQCEAVRLSEHIGNMVDTELTAEEGERRTADVKTWTETVGNGSLSSARKRCETYPKVSKVGRSKVAAIVVGGIPAPTKNVRLGKDGLG